MWDLNQHNCYANHEMDVLCEQGYYLITKWTVVPHSCVQLRNWMITKKKKNQAYLSSSNYNSVQDLASFLKRVGWQIWNFQVKCKSVGVDDMVNE